MERHTPDFIYPISWTAHYDTGVTYDQYTPQGELSYGLLDQDRLVALSYWKDGKFLISADCDGFIVIKGHKINICFPNSQKKFRLICFRRVRRDFHPDGERVTTKYFIGLQETIKNKNFQQLISIDDDGTIELHQVK